MPAYRIFACRIDLGLIMRPTTVATYSLTDANGEGDQENLL